VRNSATVSGAPNHHAVHHPLMERRGTAQEVADMVAWLAGSQARFVTGQVLHVNGGTYLG
jgi:3-oxoacyl-[acyl-carrier protein] reductase